MIHDSTRIKIDRQLELFFDNADRQIHRESKEGITYLKKYAETDGLELLNKVYGYNLILCTKINEQSIDGEDNDNKLGVQISNRQDKDKFRNTIKSFPPKGKIYLTKIIFLVLTYNSRWNSYRSWTDLNNSYFNCKTNIISLFDLHKEIMSIVDIKKVIDIISTLHLMFAKEFDSLIDDLNGILLKNNDLQKIKNSVMNLQQETF